MNRNAYELGAQLALQEAGLVKKAGLPSSLFGRLVGSASSNPLLTRAAIGAGLGAAGGGATDIGAGRGALAGVAAGLGSGYGARMGQKMLGRTVGAERAAIRAAARTGASPATTEASKLFDFSNKWGFGGPGWQRHMATARGLGGVGLGSLAGGGALMATKPEEKGFLGNLLG